MSVRSVEGQPTVGLAEVMRRMLPAIWLGVLLTIALVIAPLLFAQLDRAVAGRLANRLFSLEAQIALGFSVVLAVLERLRAARHSPQRQRSQFSVELGCVLGALLVTVLGHYALLPLIEAARAGQGTLSFGALHTMATVCYGIKTVLVAVLTVRAARS